MQQRPKFSLAGHWLRHKSHGKANHFKDPGQTL